MSQVRTLIMRQARWIGIVAQTCAMAIVVAGSGCGNSGSVACDPQKDVNCNASTDGSTKKDLEDDQSVTVCTTGCVKDNTCMLGTTVEACGNNGSFCQTCGRGQSCVSGFCTQDQSSCNATTCPFGCCNGLNQCIPYLQQSNSVCGTGGSYCSTCSTVSGTGLCQQGKCTSTTTCNSTSCPSGCCHATTGACMAYNVQFEDLCGTNGQTCAQCGSGNSCTLGVCSGDQSPKWAIKVVSAVLNNTLKWDDGDGVPDPFVKITINKTKNEKQSDHKSNTYDPTYNQEVITATELELTHSSGITIEVRDHDSGIGPLPASDDSIAICPVKYLTLGDLQAGSMTLGPCSASQDEINKKGVEAQEAVKQVLIEFFKK